MGLHKMNVSDLIPYANNARTHSDEQISQIASSIKEFGFINPVITDADGGIIAGHGRVIAARKLGIEKVPVVPVDHLSDAQKKAYILADNRMALSAGWDDDLLSIEISELSDLDFDLSLTGFDDDEIEALLDDGENDGLTDDDALPEIHEDPITKLGDVWIMGNHRLMCGDSTSIDAVETLMDGQKADMIFTDPPYGMSYGGGRSIHVGQTDVAIKNFGMIHGDDLQGDDLLQMIADSVGNAKSFCKEGAAVYVCFTWRTYAEFQAALSSVGLEPKSCIVWNKKSIGLGMQSYRPQHEFIFYCGGQWYGDKSQSDVWSIGRDSGYVHPTQKPVELIERALLNSSKRDDIIYDCFGGSGSTMIACEKSNRSSRLMELDPKYCDVIVKRWQDYTGKQAALESDGKLFGEVRDGAG